jgi:hypothetical protein
MNDTMVMDNKQICWDNAMDSGLEYAVKWLDGETRVMLKAQSDIMARKANATTTKRGAYCRCEANQGFKFSPATADVMMKVPLETIPLGILICYLCYSPFLPNPFVTLSITWC